MTIDEAIEATKEADVFLKIHHQGRLAQGVELGIEALKFYHKHKWISERFYWRLLPGETEEEEAHSSTG